MKKKTLAVLMTATLTVSCLAACGNSSDGSKGSDDKKDADSGEITLNMHTTGRMRKKFWTNSRRRRWIQERTRKVKLCLCPGHMRTWD